jgi:hypothetical protein
MLIAGLIFFTAVLWFSFFYLFSDYQQLVKWYLGLNSCIYRSGQWSSTFFTPAIKSLGNIYCIPAIALSIGGTLYIARAWRQGNKTNIVTDSIRFDALDLVPILICLVAATRFWIIGNDNAMPAFDEMFSTIHSAGAHPMQTISYYMLPNNHMLYNLLNGLLFHTSADKVITGRIISLVCYYLLSMSVFFLVKGIVQNRWLAGLVAIALILQFPVWTFSFQARGYELYLLAEWGLFISLFSYLTSHKKYWLYVNAACCVTGYFCMPSFLFFHGGQLLFMVLYWVFYQQKEFAFWKYQLIAVLLTFLCYVPVLCLSGLDAIIHNYYVAPMKVFKTTAPFVAWMFPYFNDYINHIFSDVKLGSIPLSLVLYLLPLTLLLARRQKATVMFGMFYFSIWLTFFVMAIIMRRVPFERILIGHYSMALLGCICVAYWIVGRLGDLAKRPQVKWVLFPAIPLLFAWHFFKTNKGYLFDTPYEYEVNTVYADKVKSLRDIPPESTVGVSDEEFSSGFVCMKKGCVVHYCTTGNETYFIKQKYESAPPYLAEKYVLTDTNKVIEIYRKK